MVPVPTPGPVLMVWPGAHSLTLLCWLRWDPVYMWPVYGWVSFFGVTDPTFNLIPLWEAAKDFLLNLSCLEMLSQDAVPWT